MDNTKVLTMVIDAIKLSNDGISPTPKLFEVKAILEEDIRNTKNKKVTSSSKITALKRLLKLSNKDKFKYAYFEDGKQYFCNGYQLVALNKALDFPKPSENFIYPNTKILFIDKKNKKDTSIITTEIPNLAKLKAWYKIKKADIKNMDVKNVCFDFGKDGLMLNAKYLIDMLTIIEPTKMYYSKSKMYKHRMYFENEVTNDIGILSSILPTTSERRNCLEELK